MNSLCVLTLNTLAGYRSPDKQASLAAGRRKATAARTGFRLLKWPDGVALKGADAHLSRTLPGSDPFFVRLHPLNNSALVVLQHEFPGVVLDAVQHVKSRRG